MVWKMTIIHYCGSYITAYTRWERGRAQIRWNIGYKVIRNIQCPCCIHTWLKFVTLPVVCFLQSYSLTHCNTHTYTYKIFFRSTKPAFYYHFMMLVYWFWSIIIHHFRNFWFVIGFLNVKFEVVLICIMKACRVERGIISIFS